MTVRLTHDRQIILQQINQTLEQRLKQFLLFWNQIYYT